MADALTNAEFEQTYRPMLDKLQVVTEQESYDFHNRNRRFDFSHRNLANGSTWILYWQGKDKLAAATLNELVKGQLVRNAQCYIRV